MNVNNEMRHMSDYLAEIWSLEQKEVFNFIEKFYKVLSENNGYKNYLGDSPDYLYLIRDVMKNREAQLENRFYTMIDGLSVLCSNLLSYSDQEQKDLSFDKIYKKVFIFIG